MRGGFPGGSLVKTLPANAGDAGDVGSILAREDPEEEMANHANILPGQTLTEPHLVGYTVHGVTQRIRTQLSD